jgi:ubiquinone/menaquinone biosynthesis C-methylase UbiE
VRYRHLNIPVIFILKNREEVVEMNVVEFDKVAREVFAPAYIAFAGQIKKATGITKGVCLDAGSGGGYLGIALANITDLDMILLDQSQEMQDIADRNILEAGLGKRLRTLFADVHEIPLDDCSVNLVVSRGSVFFWEDQAKAFREIYRVLAPGGVTFVGGGFGSVALKKQIDQEMVAIHENWLDVTRERMSADMMTKFRRVLDGVGVPYEIKSIEAGFGIMIRRAA